MHELGPKKLPTWKPVKVYKYTNKQLNRLPQTWATLIGACIVLILLDHAFLWLILVALALAGLGRGMHIVRNRSIRF